jgi:uncharacterized membrane protein
MMFHFYIPEGICFAAFVAFVARGYTMQFLIYIYNIYYISSIIKLHKDGNITSKLIEQYSAAGC